ncbi:unnamed protein product [Leptosia nina]|uniref:Protein PTHB1 n=1 Tax=Leptosia nina TaxID=320188 RepID=A0AAV1JV30_9NEOP
MSIFKVKQLWSNERLQNEDYLDGIQNSSSVKVDKFNLSNDSDCILLAEGQELKIYKPNIEQEDAHVILESHESDIILQIETGKFIIDSSDRQILLLHPQSFAIYLLERKEGHIDAGDQNYLRPILKHDFTRKAYRVIVGPFGVAKSRELICIQALDGTMSFFEQDTFLFMCLFPDVIIPGPISYVPSSDLFIICTTSWVMEIYSYQQLREFSELSGRQNKKIIPQWSYSPGEELSAVQVIRTSSTFSSIIALGERYLYCFQDNGLMKYMLRFDFMPVCFHAYLVGWYYEPNSRLLNMVVSEDSKLHVYEDTMLLWSCDLLHKTISISRCFIKNLSGGLVTLSNKGIVSVSYLGTEPDLNSTIVPINADPGPRDIEEELKIVEEALDKFVEKADDSLHLPSQLVKVNIEFGKAVESFIEELDSNLPFTVSDSTVCLDEINGTEIVETRIFLIGDMAISNTHTKFIFTITETSGQINVVSKNELLPLALYARRVELNSDCEFNMSFTTNQKYLSFDNIFTDLPPNTNSTTFLYKNTNKIVIFQMKEEQYTIEAKDCVEIFPIVNNILHRFEEYYRQKSVNNFEIAFNMTPELIKQIIHKFLKCVEVHAKERLQCKDLEAQLNVLQSQFTLIQKKLLVQYGSLPPSNCDPLEFLMRDTYSNIIATTEMLLTCRQNVIRASCDFSAVGNLLLCVLKHSEVEDIKIKILEETLSLETIHEDTQEWEESVTQASSHILNTILKKEKDRERLAPITDQDILSHVNLKRFLRQTKIILDSMFLQSTEVKEKITRIEEFVEVI